eukprot:364208-Chlamydomonas_euryale.AAC.35
MLEEEALGADSRLVCVFEHGLFERGKRANRFSSYSSLICGMPFHTSLYECHLYSGLRYSRPVAFKISSVFWVRTSVPVSKLCPLYRSADEMTRTREPIASCVRQPTIGHGVRTARRQAPMRSAAHVQDYARLVCCGQGYFAGALVDHFAGHQHTSPGDMGGACQRDGMRSARPADLRWGMHALENPMIMGGG